MRVQGAWIGNSRAQAGTKACDMASGWGRPLWPWFTALLRLSQHTTQERQPGRRPRITVTSSPLALTWTSRLHYLSSAGERAEARRAVTVRREIALLYARAVTGAGRNTASLWGHSTKLGHCDHGRAMQGEENFCRSLERCCT